MLADKLRARIRADGPMPFEEYMAACLYDEEFGFFSTGPLRSVKEGDFLTSPEVSPWFGRTLARWVAKEQQRTGADPFWVVEAGAGSGSLLRPLMQGLSSASAQSSSSPSGGGAERSEAEGVRQIHTKPPDPPPGLAAGLPPEGGEESGELRLADSHSHVPPTKGRGDAEKRSDEAGGHLSPSTSANTSLPPPQGEVAPARATEGVREFTNPTYEFRAIEASPAAREALTDLIGPNNVHTSLDDLPERFNGVIIANELLDNLPCALAIRTAEGWIERWVGATDDRFGFVTAPARLDVATWCDAYAGNLPEGGMVEVQLQAVEWIESALQHIHRGALAVIDYGGTAEELEPRRTQGTLRTYRSHHLGPDPLLEPGATDVTVDVNFTAMLAAAESEGVTTELHRQDDFLASLGLRDELRELRHRERDLARSGEAMDRLIVRSEATDLETLLHPRGLGDFRVMIAHSD